MASLPDEILLPILSLVPFKGSNWLNIKLTCKQFFSVSFVTFDVSKNLIKACEGGSVETVKTILAHKKCDPTIGNNYPIRAASKRGKIEIVNLFLEMGINFNFELPYVYKIPSPTGFFGVYDYDLRLEDTVEEVDLKHANKLYFFFWQKSHFLMNAETWIC